MADVIDIAQEQQALMLEEQIHRTRSMAKHASAFHCEDCDSLIPEARRIAVPGVNLCVNCQELKERQQRHFVQR